jgi:hypothetical protein
MRRKKDLGLRDRRLGPSRSGRVIWSCDDVHDAHNRVVLGTGGAVLMHDTERCLTYNGLILAAPAITRYGSRSKTLQDSKDKLGTEGNSEEVVLLMRTS